MTHSVFTAIMAALGAWVSRMCGGGWPKLPWGLDQFVYALPYGGFPLYFAAQAHGWTSPWPYLVAAACYGLAVLGKRTGHGQYFLMGYGVRLPELDEKIEPFVKLFFGEDTGGRYWRCAFGLAVTGLIVTIPAGGALGFYLSPLAGLIVAASGVTKALVYMIGWASYRLAVRCGMDDRLADFIAGRVPLPPPPKTLAEKVIHPTLWGEIGTGFFGWGFLTWVA